MARARPVTTVRQSLHRQGCLVAVPQVKFAVAAKPDNEPNAGQWLARPLGTVSQHMRSRFERRCPQDQPRRMLLPVSLKDVLTFGLREIQAVHAPTLCPSLRS